MWSASHGLAGTAPGGSPRAGRPTAGSRLARRAVAARPRSCWGTPAAARPPFAGERVVLPEDARRDERQHRSGLRAGDAAAEEATRLDRRSPPVITRIDSVAARTHSPRSMMRASATSAPSLSPVTSRTGSSALRDGFRQLLDGLARGCTRWRAGPAGPAWCRRWRRSPSRRCARRSGCRAALTSRTRTSAASRPARRSRCARSARRCWTSARTSAPGRWHR